MAEFLHFIGKLKNFGFLFLKFFVKLAGILFLLVIEFLYFLVIFGHNFLEINFKVFDFKLFLLYFLLLFFYGLNKLSRFVLWFFEDFLILFDFGHISFNLSSDLSNYFFFNFILCNNLILFHFESRNNVLKLNDLLTLDQLVLHNGLFLF